MTMTKTDYAVIAAGISDCIRQEHMRHRGVVANEAELYRHTVHAIEGVARQLAAKFALTHKAFNVDKFMAACEIDSHENAEQGGGFAS